MTLESLLFYPAAIVAVVATLMVVLGRHPVYQVLNLVASLFAIAMIFHTLGGQFIMWLEIIVYAGAIVVLFLFVTMMLNLGNKDEEDLKRPTGRQLIVPLLCFAVLAAQTVLAASAQAAPPGDAFTVSPQMIGRALFNDHFLGVKLASVILMIGGIGGMHFGAAASVPDEKAVPLDAQR